MRFISTAVAALVVVLIATPTKAQQNVDWVGIGVETGFLSGTTASWPNLSGGLCGAIPDGHGGNCVFIPVGKTITHVYGTMTIKSDTVELLTAIVCGTGADWRVIWQGHGITKGTIPVFTPKLPSDYHTTGNAAKTQACWVMWQAVNAGSYTGSGRGAEWQLTFTAQ